MTTNHLDNSVFDSKALDTGYELSVAKNELLALRLANQKLQQQNEILRRGFTGDYCLDSWLDFVKEKEQLQQQNAELVARVGRLEGFASVIADQKYGLVDYLSTRAKNLLNETTQQSLQHIQAEAVEAFADWYCSDIDDVNVKMRAKIRAKQLRQQQTNGSDGE